MIKGIFRFLSIGGFCALGIGSLHAAILKGTISDSTNGEPLIGASVAAGKVATVTDIDGNFSLRLPRGRHSLSVKYIGYRDTVINNINIKADTLSRSIALLPSSTSLGEVTVTASIRRNTEIAQIQEQRNSSLIQSGVSAQQVEKTQDKDASEVVRRIPGISIIDEKFVMVRGLSQRYNNVWLNGSAVPSSEADSRAFSFDIIPSSQLDNLSVIKSPAPEYPADFTGGFILVNTKQDGTGSSLNFSLGTAVNDQTHFREFKGTNGHSDFPPAQLNSHTGHPERIDLLNNKFVNDWSVRSFRPLPDMKLNASYSGNWITENNTRYGLSSAANYSNGYRTILNMENSLYGPYDASNEHEVPLRKAVDNQYTHDTRAGAMLNAWMRPNGGNTSLEWKNVFNVITKDRYSDRTGYNAQADNINDMEYYYSRRMTFNTQITGKHSLAESSMDWSAGYAYANRDLPDRRLIQRTDRTENTMGIYRISREFTRLDEHIGSLNANYSRNIALLSPTAQFKAGLYGEYRTRKYDTRQFQYGWQPSNTLPNGFLFNPDVQNDVLVSDNYGPDKLYLYEEINFLNNYRGQQAQTSAYTSLMLPWDRFTVYAGLRYEYCRQVLQMNTRQYQQSLHSTVYNYNDLFPSLNAVYRLNERNQLRAAYGRSTNRPEFRELSSSVYYDFDLGSSVMGNASLKAAYIHNMDLRYEFYPSKGEQISLAAFYKRFKNPIEWTYTVAGGTDLIYSFVNAMGADNYGLELDIRKCFDFIGIPQLSFSFNGALIRSRVRFPQGGNNIDRPMQGQSPYLVNTGLFYNIRGFNAAVLYNCIGRRIIGVGNRYGTASDGTPRNIPNSYEMPRHSLDLSLGKKLGQWNIKCGIRDILAQRYLFKQIEEISTQAGSKTIEEVTRSYRPGRTYNLSVSYEF